MFFRLKRKFYYLITNYVYKFKDKGRYNVIFPYKHITFRNLSLKNNVSIFYGSRIEAIKRYNQKTFNGVIGIGNNVRIQQNIHITCGDQIYIEDEVAIGANVTITDIKHLHEDIAVPVEKQNIETNPVRIKYGSKIFNNTVILPGVVIGRNSVVGANSVVTKSVPDYVLYQEFQQR